METGYFDLDPEKPHAICSVVDSTPFDQGSLRTSEVKTIAVIAAFNHVKPEYHSLDRFGVSDAATCLLL